MVVCYHMALHASAASFAVLRQTFSSADYVAGFTIFDVGGNSPTADAHLSYKTPRLSDKINVIGCVGEAMNPKCS